MKPCKIVDNVYWVGAIDWNLKNFHGYLTQRGSTYNAYLIIDQKVVLIDTVKHYLYEQMLSRISKIIDPSKIDYIISNHTEMDHSGSLPKIVKLAKDAVVVASPNGEKGLRKHFEADWNFKIVKTGDTINIGKRNLQFVLAPMVHWPDSMATYMPEEQFLFSNDAFGQHIASVERFDDEMNLGIVKEEAAKYYANIVLPFGEQVKKVIAALDGLPIKIIAPSHGIIWRKNIDQIINLYKKWSDNITDNKAVIVYDTMWGSTEKMAYALADSFEQLEIPYKIKNLQAVHISDIMTDILEAKYICVGSPTLNNGLLPSVSAFLTYLKGLAPKKRIGIAFGSYGWGGQSVDNIEGLFEQMGFNLPLKGLKIPYVPEAGEIKNFQERVIQTITKGGENG